MVSAFAALSESEVQELGLSSIVNAGNFDQDNPLMNAIGTPLPQTDKVGRQVISYDQYKQLDKIGARMDNYALRMIWPGRAGVNTIQASKFLKWWGLGYRPLGIIDDIAKKRKMVAPVGKDGEMPDDVAVYWCREKYEDCPRFFDTQRGLKFHWNRDHGEDGKIAKRRPTAKVNVEAAEDDE